MTNSNPLVHNVRLIVFDFDGVLTNNMVYVDQNGVESVCCARSDGLAFDAFKKLGLPTLILSTEKNPVVSTRGSKLNIPVHQSVEDKQQAIRNIAKEKDIPLKNICYVGNDLNDFYAMSICGVKICPFDSHPEIKTIADVILTCSGGHGVAREIAEQVLKINLLTVLYKERKI